MTREKIKTAVRLYRSDTAPRSARRHNARAWLTTPDDALRWTEIVVYALLVVFVGGLALWCMSRLAPFIL